MPVEIPSMSRVRTVLIACGAKLAVDATAAAAPTMVAVSMGGERNQFARVPT